jgi:hypothetical protein
MTISEVTTTVTPPRNPNAKPYTFVMRWHGRLPDSIRIGGTVPSGTVDGDGRKYVFNGGNGFVTEMARNETGRFVTHDVTVAVFPIAT